MKIRKIVGAGGLALALAVGGGVVADVAQAPPAAANHNGGAQIHIVSDNFDTYVLLLNHLGHQFTLSRNATSCCYPDWYGVWVAPWHKATVGNYNDNWQRTEWSYDQGHWMIVDYEDANKPHTYVRTGGH